MKPTHCCCTCVAPCRRRLLTPLPSAGSLHRPSPIVNMHVSARWRACFLVAAVVLIACVHAASPPKYRRRRGAPSTATGASTHGNAPYGAGVVVVEDSPSPSQVYASDGIQIVVEDLTYPSTPDLLSSDADPDVDYGESTASSAGARSSTGADDDFMADDDEDDTYAVVVVEPGEPATPQQLDGAGTPVSPQPTAHFSGPYHTQSARAEYVHVGPSSQLRGGTGVCLTPTCCLCVFLVFVAPAAFSPCC